jgi:anti-sigma B factor antagonist
MIDLQLESRTDGPWTVVEVEGEVDVYTAGKFREHIAEQVEGGNHRLIVDLTKVPFMDSTGLGVLVGALKRVRERDGALMLVCKPDNPVLRVFSITGLNKVFNVKSSVGEVLQKEKAGRT